MTPELTDGQAQAAPASEMRFHVIESGRTEAELAVPDEEVLDAFASIESILHALADAKITSYAVWPAAHESSRPEA